MHQNLCASCTGWQCTSTASSPLPVSPPSSPSPSPSPTPCHVCTRTHTCMHAPLPAQGPGRQASPKGNVNAGAMPLWHNPHMLLLLLLAVPVAWRGHAGHATLPQHRDGTAQHSLFYSCNQRGSVRCKVRMHCRVGQVVTPAAICHQRSSPGWPITACAAGPPQKGGRCSAPLHCIALHCIGAGGRAVPFIHSCMHARVCVHERGNA